MNWYPLLIAIHVALAVSLLAPSLVLPFLLAGRAGASGAIRLRLVALQERGGRVLAIGVAISGALLLALLGIELLTKPWLLVALALYAANIAIAIGVVRPNLRRLVGFDPNGDQARWSRLARRQRWLAYAMGGAIGGIGLLMSAKPELW